jgi:hypothetical protein
MGEAKYIDFPIDFRDKFGYGPLAFLRAEWWDDRSRFVLVRYSLEGKEHELGLRLDLDKKIFLDHFNDPYLDKFAQAMVRPIWEYIVYKRSVHSAP